MFVTKYIELPYDTNLQNTIDFCNRLDITPEAKKIVFDHQNLGFVTPFGMLLIGAKIRRFCSKRQTTQFFDRNYKGKSYAANMGFFHSVNQPFGKKPGELKGNTNYIPISDVSIKQLGIKARFNTEHMVESVERKAKKLAIVLCNEDPDLLDTLTYAIREIMRNVVEHGDVNKIWYAGQYWPTKDIVEVAILDEGIGIKKSLLKNPKLDIKDDEDALLLAIEPGISGNTKPFDANDPFSNSGFGLFMTSRICQEGGDFVICSNSRLLHINARRRVIKNINFQGTAVRLRLKVSKIESLKSYTKRLVKEGEKIARINKKKRIISASKASSLLFINDLE